MVLDNNIPEQRIITRVFAKENLTNIEMLCCLSWKFSKICIICGTSSSLQQDNNIKFPVLELLISKNKNNKEPKAFGRRSRERKEKKKENKFYSFSCVVF